MARKNLSGFSRLGLYDLLKELEAETGEPFSIWLHRIACATDPEGTCEKLQLRDDNTWSVHDHYRQCHPRSVGGITRRTEEVRAVWKFDRSLLAYWVFEPREVAEPEGIDVAIRGEGIQVYRDDFRAWFESIDCSLPAFWFPESSDTPPASSEPRPIPDYEGSEEMRSSAQNLNKGKQEIIKKNYSKAADEICKAIKEAEDTGIGWHQMGYVEDWQKNNPGIFDGPTQKETLKSKVIEMLWKKYKIKHKTTKRPSSSKK